MTNRPYNRGSYNAGSTVVDSFQIVGVLMTMHELNLTLVLKVIWVGQLITKT